MSPLPPCFETVNIAPRPAGSRIPEATVAPKRTRAKGPKVRTGCFTCKIRRVKCDEGKPKCHRCTKAGFTCDGYGRQPVEPQNSNNTAAEFVQEQFQGSSTLARRNPWPTVLSSQDVTYFDMFQHKLVHDLSGYSCQDFWSRVVLCETMTDQCMRDSVLAIGALSLAIESTSQLRHRPSLSVGRPGGSSWKTQPAINNHYEVAILHYDKAISRFRRRINTKEDTVTPRSVFIMSMLLIAFELLRSDMQAVDALINSSINVLKETLMLYHHDKRVSSRKSSKSRTEDDLEEIEYLLPLISIMCAYTPLLVSQAANFRLWSDIQTYGLPVAGNYSLFKVQTHWNRFYTRAAAFIGHAQMFQAQAIAPSPTAHEQQAAILAQLSVWKVEIDSWVSKAKLLGDYALRALHVMRIQHIMIFISASSSLDASELAFDRRAGEFQTLLARCATFLREVHPNYLFTLNTTILSALGMTLIKCRVHNTRMMAAALLRQVPWREGAWDAAFMLHGKLGGVGLEERARDGAGLIPPEHRWMWVSADWDAERDVFVANYIRAVPDKEGIPVTTKLVLGLGAYPDICPGIGCSVDHAYECGKLSSKDTFSSQA